MEQLFIEDKNRIDDEGTKTERIVYFILKMLALIQVLIILFFIYLGFFEQRSSNYSGSKCSQVYNCDCPDDLDELCECKTIDANNIEQTVYCPNQPKE